MSGSTTTRPAQPGAAANALYPVSGVTSLTLDDKVICSTRSAFATARPETNGDLLVPEEDIPAKHRLEIGELSTRVAPDGSRLLKIDLSRISAVVKDEWPAGVQAASTVNGFPRWGDLSDLVRLMDVEAQDNTVFRAPTYDDRRRNVVEGSQILGQSIVAASSVVPEQRVVSAYAIFSRPAGFHLPLDFHVNPVRVGRSFSTMSVEVRQDDKSMASALALMDRGAPDKIKGQVTMPDLPGPDDCPFYDYGMTGRDVRFVNGDYSRDVNHVGSPELHAWVRHREAPESQAMRQALVAQFTGHLTIGASLLPHPGLSEALAHVSLSTGVLSISIAFHEEADLTGWLLYSNPSIYAGRGLAQGEGHVFAQTGELVASYTVQAMIRDFNRDPNAIGLDQSRLM